MPRDPSEQYDIYFDEPRLRMTLGGRFTVRVVSYISYIILIFAAGTFLISGITSLRFLGGLLVLFLLDRAIHLGQADLPVSELPHSGRVNIARVARPTVLSVFGRVFDRGLISKRDFFLMVAERLMDFDLIKEGLRRLDVKPEEFKAKLEEALTKPVPAGEVSRGVYLQGAEALIRIAFIEALTAGHNFIELADVFSALAKIKSEQLERLFALFSIEPDDLGRALIFSAERRRVGKSSHGIGGFVFASHRRIPHRIMNRAWTARPTYLLDRYGTDLTDLARSGYVGFLVGHRTEYGTLLETLSRSMNPNALLVGDAGIGKETMIEHLAFALTRDEVPKTLFDKRLVRLELQALVAGAPPEELSARLTKIADEIRTAGNLILYIPDIHNLVRTSGTAYLSAADVLMPIIMDNAFPIIGASYPKEFKEFIETRSDFLGAFEVIHVSEITDAEAERILTFECLFLEQSHPVTVSFGAVKRAVMLAKEYFRPKFLPGSAEELLKSAIVDAEKRREKTLTADRVTAVAETKTNVPLHEAGKEEADKLLHMEDIIHERMIDQEEAVSAVAEALREYRSGLTRKGGPIASFLFVGPTGVGKTQLAKILADIQFGSEKMMLRFDMTEYQDKTSFFRLIGTPDGQSRGMLTDAIREKPYSLILLDEFEKAFPDVLNLFLQVLDDGRLTDNLGRTVDFSNTIIIATSNAHSDIINDALRKGESMAAIAEYLKTRLTDVFKPELINRFSKVVIFKDLAPADLAKITVLNLQELAGIASEQGITLDFDPEAVAKLSKLGYDPMFGARPLRRVIDEKVRSLLSRAILEKKIGKGSRAKLVVAGDDFDIVNEGTPGAPGA